MKCWEFMNCPKDAYESCPAYPDNGYDCWKVPFTRCAHGKSVTSTILERMTNCKQCEFYRKNGHSI